MGLANHLTVEEAAKLIGVPKSQIYYAILTKKIKHEPKGKNGKLIQRSEVLKYKSDRLARKRRLQRRTK